jgi:hypothetical protein
MIPNAFTLSAIQESFRDLYAKLNKWLTGNVDLSGRRIINAGASVGPSDYVTRDELTTALKSISTATAATNSTNNGTTVPIGGPLRNTSPIRVGAYAYIGTAIAHPQEAYIATDRNYSVYYSDGATWTEFQSIELDDTATNTVTNAANFIHRSSGTPAASFGVSLNWKLDSSTNVLRIPAIEEVIWTTATNANESADYVLLLMAAGVVATEKFRVTSAGQIQATTAALSGLTAGSVTFSGTSGLISQDNANFFWDSTNHRLGLGNTGPTKLLSVGSGSQFTVDTSGNVVIAGTVTQNSGNVTIAGNIGFFGASAQSQQASGADLTNNVTSGGSSDVIADFTSLTVYATDAATIRNDIYQLARKLKMVNDALRKYGLLT